MRINMAVASSAAAGVSGIQVAVQSTQVREDRKVECSELRIVGSIEELREQMFGPAQTEHGIAGALPLDERRRST